MVGASCSIFGCSSSRRTSGVAIFKVPQGDDECLWLSAIFTTLINFRTFSGAVKMEHGTEMG